MPGWNARILFLSLIAQGASGCLPFVVPPARVSVGSAAHVDPFPGSLPSESEQAVLALRAGAHPFDLVEGAEQRLLDFGLGYHAELGPEGSVPSVHGPYLELGAYPLSAELGPRVHLRGGAFGTIDGLWRSGLAEPGLGGSLGVSVEVVGSGSGGFLESGSDGTGVAGYAHGRWGFGLFGSGAVRDFSDGAYRALSVGVSVRLPLIAGVLCCALPDFSSRSSSSGGRRAARSAREPRLVREPASPRRKD